MGLFGNKKVAADQKSILDIPDPAGYNEVVDYLVGLSDQEYDTVQKVANIYREADKKAAESLGVDCEITSFIRPPEVEKDLDYQDLPSEPMSTAVDDFLDTEMTSVFLDEEPVQAKDKIKKTKQKVMAEIKSKIKKS